MRILSDVLGPAGFAFADGSSGSGLGGRFARGSFRAEERTVSFSVRGSLGEVHYTWGLFSASHDDLMWGTRAEGEYPGFGDDPLDAFRDLGQDLQGPLSPFVVGDRPDWFESAIEFRDSYPRPRIP